MIEKWLGAVSVFMVDEVNAARSSLQLRSLRDIPVPNRSVVISTFSDAVGDRTRSGLERAGMHRRKNRWTGTVDIATRCQSISLTIKDLNLSSQREF